MRLLLAVVLLGLAGCSAKPDPERLGPAEPPVAVPPPFEWVSDLLGDQATLLKFAGPQQQCDLELVASYHVRDQVPHFIAIIGPLDAPTAWHVGDYGQSNGYTVMGLEVGSRTIDYVSGVNVTMAGIPFFDGMEVALFIRNAVDDEHDRVASVVWHCPAPPVLVQEAGSPSLRIVSATSSGQLSLGGPAGSVLLEGSFDLTVAESAALVVTGGFGQGVGKINVVHPTGEWNKSWVPNQSTAEGYGAFWGGAGRYHGNLSFAGLAPQSNRWALIAGMAPL